MKKNVLMIVAWYPTKDNLVRGGFFRERAQHLSKIYNINILQVDQKLVHPITGFLKILKSYFKSKQITSYLIDNDPKSFYYITYGIKPSILPKFLFKKINHNLYEIGYQYAYYSIIKLGFKTDLIYAASAQTCGSFAWKLHKLFNVPYVISEHSIFSNNSLGRINTKIAIEEAHAILSISHDKTRQFLFCNLNCNPIYIGNPVDGNRLSLKPDNSNNIHSRILTVASYTWMKDYETFFKTIKHLKQISINNFTVSVVGIGKDLDKQQLFKDKLVENQIEDKVELYPYIERDNMIDYYHTHDVLLVTSIAEGMSNSVLEALACGLPVYSTICGGSEDLIENQSGKLFHLQDYKTIAEALNELIEGKIRYNAKYIREKVLSDYGIDVYLSRMQTIFNDVIDKYYE